MTHTDEISIPDQRTADDDLFPEVVVLGINRDGSLMIREA